MDKEASSGSGERSPSKKRKYWNELAKEVKGMELGSRALIED